MNQIINELKFYEYVLDSGTKYYIAAYLPQQADQIFIMRIMVVEKLDSADPMRYEMSSERVKLLDLQATEPGLIRVVK